MFKQVPRPWLALALTFAMGSVFPLGSVAIAGGNQTESMAETRLSINGYEGILREMDVPAALLAMKELKIGQPLFLKELETIEAYGIASCQGGLQRGTDRVHVFRLKFQSEGQAISSINLKRQPTERPGVLVVEDPKNTRNPHFRLFFDGTSWSGFRRKNEVVVLLKGAVSQEDFFRIMEKVL